MHDTIILKTPSKADSIERVGCWRINLSVVAILAIIARSTEKEETTMESITGKVLRTFPRDTNTDEIISGKYKYDELDLNKLAVHTFESIDPAFYADSKRTKGQIIVAAPNFGCGSSREQADRSEQ